MARQKDHTFELKGPFALKGKYPKLSAPNDEHPLYQRFSVGFQGHFDTIDVCLSTFSHDLAPNRRYVSTIQSRPCCGKGIAKREVEDYLSTLLDDSLGRGEWIRGRWTREEQVGAGGISGWASLQGSWLTNFKCINSWYCNCCSLSRAPRLVPRQALPKTQRWLFWRFATLAPTLQRHFPNRLNTPTPPRLSAQTGNPAA